VILNIFQLTKIAKSIETRIMPSQDGRKFYKLKVIIKLLLTIFVKEILVHRNLIPKSLKL